MKTSEDVADDVLDAYGRQPGYDVGDVELKKLIALHVRLHTSELLFQQHAAIKQRIERLEGRSHVFGHDGECLFRASVLAAVEGESE